MTEIEDSVSVIQAITLMKSHLVTASAESTIAEAIDRMDIYQVDELPVIDEVGGYTGMVLEADIAAYFLNQLQSASGHDGFEVAALRPLRDVIREPIAAVRDIEPVTWRLVERLLTVDRRIPVIDESGKLIGSLNRVDVIQALIEHELIPKREG